ncbi:SPOR domain-containing protein, partial [Polaribacter sp.]|uniref:SPOR domain-containing protein n=1 Tax=Polaribacter sp. TaxID=1920175 RepID=UPI003F6C805A
AAAISLSVINWQNKLQTSNVELNNLGTFSLNEEKKIVFKPTTEINYLTSSFGLSAVKTSNITRHNATVKPLHQNTKKEVPTFIKYAATAAILLTLGFAGYNGYQQNKQKETIAKQEKNLEKKLQSATFVIQNPLPTLQLNVSKEIAKPFYVVAGAFQFPENAAKKVTQLKKKGFNAKIIGLNKWGLTQVCFDSFAEKNDAINSLNKIKRTVSNDAWLLIKRNK